MDAERSEAHYFAGAAVTREGWPGNRRRDAPGLTLMAAVRNLG